MDLVIVIILLIIEGILLYWILGNAYSLMRSPAVYFPVPLASKMAMVTIVGFPLAGIGGVFLSVLIFHSSFSKRRDYNIIYGLIAGTIISILCSAALLVSALYLAWEIIG